MSEIQYPRLLDATRVLLSDKTILILLTLLDLKYDISLNKISHYVKIMLKSFKNYV